jgi:hypothetical protein
MGTTWLPPTLSLFAFLGAGGPALGLIRILCPSRRSIWGAVAVLTLGTAAGAFAGAAVLAGQPAGVWLPPAVLLGLSVLLGLPCQHFFAFVVAQVQRPFHPPFVQATCLLIGCPALAFWLVAAEDKRDNWFEDTLRKNPVLGPEFDDISPSPLATDKGRRLRVFHLVSDSEMEARRNNVQENLLSRPELYAKVITLEAGGGNCNCHGWIFSGGRYWISGETVEVILADNGYQKTAAPRLGDLAIYRDLGGVITHTGVVRAMMPDGLVLVESKWGNLGTFLHPVDVHPYDGSTCAYHRSSRGGHRLGKAPGGVAASAVGAVSASPQARPATVARAVPSKPSVGPAPFVNAE